MKNKQITFFLIFLALIIIVVVALNYTNSTPKKSKENPYEYNVDEYKKVDPELIKYKEIRQMKVKLDDYAGIATFKENIYLGSDQKLNVFSLTGSKINQFNIKAEARAIAVNDKFIAIAYKQNFELYNHEGTLEVSSSILSDSSYYTSVAFLNDQIIIADAGKRKVYGFEGSEKKFEIEGVSGAKNLQGFIVPSPYFEVAVNNNELWITNPGMHALQQYNSKGDLINSWDKVSMAIDGFTGCCNPAQFMLFADGRFLTSEKGIPRIKIYSKEGELESVVAAPSKFEGNQHAAEVAVIDESIVALDFDREMIRIFEPK